MSATRRLPRLGVTLAGVLALSAASLSMQAQGASRSDHPFGRVEFPISCTPQARVAFERGLALLHHMMYEQAEQSFTEVASADPTCAMAHWGIAMTLFHPLWGAPPSAQELVKGQAAVTRAEALRPPTEREQAYLRAAQAFYSDAAPGYGERLAAWASAQEQVYRLNPDDVDAGLWYALSQLATAPKEDKSFARQREVGELIERLHDRAPQHPGGFHYLIHAYDNPVLAERAVEVARGYEKLAPDVPHALHMPAHIFVRLGMWPDVITWNARSASVAKEQRVGGATSLHYAHAMDYLVYAHLQRGDDEAARAALAGLSAVDRHQDSFVSAYGVAAAQARYPLERHQWHEAAALPVRMPSALSWDKYAAVEAITHFARGLGRARGGNPASADDAVPQLGVLHQRLLDSNQNYWAVLVDAQRTSILAWQRYSEGNRDEALELMRRAADLEDSVDKHPVTPSAVLPARELLGDMLALSARHEEAIAAYDAALAVSPNRFRSLYGAYQAAMLVGDEPHRAARYRATLQWLVAWSSSNRPEVGQFRRALAADTTGAQ